MKCTIGLKRGRNRIRRVRYEKYHGHRNLYLKQSDWVNYLRGRIKIFLHTLIRVCLLLSFFLLLGTQISDFMLNFSQLYHAFFLHSINNQDRVLVLSIPGTYFHCQRWCHLATFSLKARGGVK